MPRDIGIHPCRLQRPQGPLYRCEAIQGSPVSKKPDLGLLTVNNFALSFRVESIFGKLKSISLKRAQ